VKVNEETLIVVA